MFKVSLNQFNAEWANRFRDEAQKIMNMVEKNFVSILHIGSTSIDDMTANDVIDIAICLHSLADMEPCKRKVMNLLYRNVGRFYQENWSIFGKYDPSFHLHIGPYDSIEMANLFLFKLYISKHSDYRDFYVEMKKDIVNNSEESLYEFNKIHFVRNVTMLAKLEYFANGMSESDFEIIYKNAILIDKDKMSEGIVRVCHEEEDNLKNKIPQYRELHCKLMEETEKAMKRSPLYRKFRITATDSSGNPIEMDDEAERSMKSMMTDTMVRQYVRAYLSDSGN